MKHGKKLLALALALCMAFALAVPAFAAEGDPDLPSPPTADENTSANLQDHTFELYQIFAGTYSDGKLTAIQWGAGFGKEDTEDAKAAKATQVQNFLTKLKEKFPGAEGAKGVFDDIVYNPEYPERSADAVARAIQNANWQGIPDDWTEGNTNYGDTNMKAFADVAAPFLVNPSDQKVYPEALSTSGAGYYLVKDVATKSGADNQVTNMYVLEMTDAETFMPRVKADVPELDKKVLEVNDSTEDADTWGDVADYDVDDNVWFTLTGTLPTDYAEYETYKYIFHDTLSDGLEYNDGTLEVYLTSRGSTEPATLLTKDTDYTLDVVGKEITVSFTNLKANAAINASSVIQVRYSAKLLDTAKVQETNKAHLEFSNNPNPDGEGDTGNTPDDTVTVFNFKLIVNKVGEDGTTALEGAGFTLYKKYATEQTDKDADDLFGEGSEEKGYYYKVAQIDPPKEGDKPTTFTFGGLDAGEYMLTESTVPDGYNKIENMYFKIEATYEEDEIGNIIRGDDGKAIIKELKVAEFTDADGNVLMKADNTSVIVDAITGVKSGEHMGDLTASVVNLKGVVLPGTGGIGTTIFYVVGGLLIAGAGILLITKKRMKSAE